MVKEKKTSTISNRLKKNEKQLQLEKQIELEKLSLLQGNSSISSSSNDSNETTLSSCSYEKNEEEDLIDIFDILYDSDSESLQEEEPEYVQRKTLVREADFFDVLGEIPNIDNISVDISVASMPTVKSEITIDTLKNVGIDTNTSIKSSFSEEIEHIEVEEIKGEDEALKDMDNSEESDSIFPNNILDKEEEEEIKESVAMDDTLEKFLELQEQPIVTKIKEIDWEEIAREEESKRVQNHTLKFINELINKVVEIVEYINPDIHLIQNLDKRKLLKDLLAKVPQYNNEKRCCDFLNRQVMIHYKRKNSFSYIMADNPKTLLQDKQKFINAKEHLDELLARETKLLSSSIDLQKELREQYVKQKEMGENLVQTFENKVRQNLYRNNAPKLNTIVDQFLIKMKKYHKEISEVRFSMILQQHTEANLTKSLTQLEDLGNGLNMRDYDNLQAETQIMDKKIEERNAELNKLYIRCRNDIHTLAHYREKEQMTCSNIVLQNIILDSIFETKRQLRERLYSLKVQRNRLHDQIKKLSTQSGILDKPVLMYDYDATVQRCQEQQQINNYLRETMRSIEQKINEYSNHYPRLQI